MCKGPVGVILQRSVAGKGGGGMGPDLGPDLQVRLIFGDVLTLGPGKAALLDHIIAEGSISAAGRRMAMSYTRAWSLVEEMNAAFRVPLVVTARGGAGHGGATVTPEGVAVLQTYRRIEAKLHSVCADDIAEIAAAMRGEARDAGLSGGASE